MSKYQTILITGANRGIGLEFAEHYAKQAKRIIACCRKPEQAFDLQALEKSHAGLEVFSLDVTDQNQVRSLVQYIGLDPIDLLINNAGVGASRDPSAIFDTQAWLQVFEINAIAPIQIAMSLLESLSKANHSVVANISSKMGSLSDNTSGGAEIYRSSKAALNAATKSFALAQQDLGITTVLLHPGWVRTDMGGAQGLIDVKTSVAGMSTLLEDVTSQHNAGFYNYTGDVIPW